MFVIHCPHGDAGIFCSALAYSAAWIAGNGCIPLNYLMEDAATAEIARVQLWQWVHYNSVLVRLSPCLRTLMH